MLNAKTVGEREETEEDQTDLRKERRLWTDAIHAQGNHRNCGERQMRAPLAELSIEPGVVSQKVRREKGKAPMSIKTPIPEHSPDDGGGILKNIRRPKQDEDCAKGREEHDTPAGLI